MRATRRDPQTPLESRFVQRVAHNLQHTKQTIVWLPQLGLTAATLAGLVAILLWIPQMSQSPQSDSASTSNHLIQPPVHTALSPSDDPQGGIQRSAAAVRNQPTKPMRGDLRRVRPLQKRQEDKVVFKRYAPGESRPITSTFMAATYDTQGNVLESDHGIRVENDGQLLLNWAGITTDNTESGDKQ